MVKIKKNEYKKQHSIYKKVKKRDRNLSPSKVVTILYIGTCLCTVLVSMSIVLYVHAENSIISNGPLGFIVIIIVIHT